MQRDIACWNRLIFITSFSLPFSFRRSSPRSSESSVHRRLIHPIFGADFRFPPRFTLIRVELGPTKASFFAISSGRRLIGERRVDRWRWTTTTGHRSTRLVSPVSRMVAVLVLVLRAVNVGIVTGKRGRRRKGKRKREGGPGCVYTRTGIPASGHRERERDNRVWM